MTLLLAHVGGLRFAPLEVAPLVLAAALYARRARALAATPRAVPTWRQACFLGGTALIVLALASPLSHVSDELFLAHMAEHLLIADLGALLLVCGLTGPMLAPVLRVRALGWLRHLTHPLVALPAWALDLYVWHLPALYQGAVEHPALHALEHALFVGFGMAMWMALLGPLPRPAWFGNTARLLYVLAVRLLGAVLGNILVWSEGVAYPRYAAGERTWDVSPLADQNTAGAIMMVEGSIVTICLFAWLFLRAAREGEERQGLLDLARARGVALDTDRAARAVSAGRGDELRARIEEGR